MKRNIFICLLLLLGSTSFALASEIDGKWKGEINTPGGAMELVFTFEVVDGNSLIGSVESQMGVLPISNGKVDGDSFSFDVDVQGMIIHHECKVVDDSISMKVPGMEGDEIEMMLVRQ